MAEKSVYNQIKKQNGETFAQDIRRFHNGIFELPNLKNMLKYAGRDAKPLLNYLLFLKQNPGNENTREDVPSKDPIELLKKAGYTAYVANTLQKQNAIRKYFADNEELCTFNDPYRYLKYYIINAVKENVDQIKRENFPNPEREDEYGTSVISIQILKTGGIISIKNRYNHTVQNPDNTFNSNPNNIIPGLSKALEDYFNTSFTHFNTLPDNYIMLNNQIIHYTEEQQGFYFGDYYYVKDGVIHELNQDYQIMADNFIIDLKKKKVSSPLPDLCDSFPDVLNAELQEKKLTLKRDEENNHYLFADNVQIMKINDKHEITELYLPETKAIPDYFLRDNKALEKFSAPNVQHIGNFCLNDNERCHSLCLPNVLKIGDDFLSNNEELKNIDLPSVREIGDNFLYFNENCTSVNLPNVHLIGDAFLHENRLLTELNAAKLEIIGDNFLNHNKELKNINLPSVREIRHNFLSHNTICTSVHLPNVRVIGDGFLCENELLTELDTPKSEIIGDNFLNHNKELKNIDFPSVREIGSNFLYFNENCTSVNLPNVHVIGDEFLHENRLLTELDTPKSEIIGDNFLNHNKELKNIDFPSVREIGSNFLYFNENCTSVNLPNVHVIGDEFLHENRLLTELNAPKLKEIGDNSLYWNENCTSVNLPNKCLIGKNFLHYISFKNTSTLEKSSKSDKNSKKTLSFLYILHSLYDVAQETSRSLKNCFVQKNQSERS